MVQARHVVCLLGAWESFAPVEAALARAPGFTLDRDFSALAPDDRMPEAFAACMDRVDPTFGAEDEQAIARHRAVAYVLSPPLAPEEAPEISRRLLILIGELLDAGALAVKGESSGIAHGASRWRELAAAAASKDRRRRASAIRRGWVRRPIQDGDILYSCGMHLLGQRDIEVRATDDISDDLGWIDLFAIYALTEMREGGLADGDGFRDNRKNQRRIVRARPCERYAPDDFFYNPQGYWLLDEER